MSNAIGMIETKGYVAAMAAADPVRRFMPFSCPSG